MDAPLLVSIRDNPLFHKCVSSHSVLIISIVIFITFDYKTLLQVRYGLFWCLFVMKIRTEIKMAKETWIQGQCQEVEACLKENNSKKAYQLVKDLTTEKQGKSTTIQDKSGKCLTEKNEILNRWTAYCSDLYNYETDEDPIVLECPQIPDEEHHPILREEVEAAVKALKMWKSAGVDNIPAELVQAGGEAMIDILAQSATRYGRQENGRAHGLNP